MKKKIIATIGIILAILAVVCISCGLIVYLNMCTLSEYTDSIVSKYSETKLLSNYDRCDDVLDEVENYIQDNLLRLAITDYTRNDHSIEVTFLFFYIYIIQPAVDGYDCAA